MVCVTLQCTRCIPCLCHVFGKFWFQVTKPQNIYRDNNRSGQQCKWKWYMLCEYLSKQNSGQCERSKGYSASARVLNAHYIYKDTCSYKAHMGGWCISETRISQWTLPWTSDRLFLFIHLSNIQTPESILPENNNNRTFTASDHHQPLPDHQCRRHNHTKVQDLVIELKHTHNKHNLALWHVSNVLMWLQTRNAGVVRLLRDLAKWTRTARNEARK